MKQFVLLEGRPIFQWSIDLMVEVGCAPVVVTLPGDVLEEGRARLADPSRVLLVEGGQTRQRSVALGLAHVESEKVVVHDAARPLATPAMVHAVLAALEGNDGVITGVRVGDTVKKARDEVVAATIDRSDLWLSQTPQAFMTSALKRAHARAEKDDLVASDDAELIEHYGGKVTIVPGSRTNVKITFADDFRFAEALARTL